MIALLSIAILILSIACCVLYHRQRKHKEDLLQACYKDWLTGGYNDFYLKEKLHTELSRHTDKAALVAFDIDMFQEINEIYGVKTGDKILKNMFHVLHRHSKNNGFVVHMRADEFMVLHFYETIDQLNQWMERILQEINDQIQQHTKVYVSISSGIYLIEEINHVAEKMCDCANAARTFCKKQQKKYLYFHESMRRISVEQKEFEQTIESAIAKKEFCAWFQPKYNAQTKELIGAEALIRWNKPDGTIGMPGQFIPMCEKNGKILNLDRLMFEYVCSSLKRWIKKGWKPVPISVNMSRVYLENKDVIQYLVDTLEKYDVPAKYLNLEITESSMIEREEVLAQLVEQMQSIGFGVLLDDYGAGYSSLKYMNLMNFDSIKIDKSFTDTIGTTKGNSIVQHTVFLAHSLGMKVIAEGVETELQYKFLCNCGCDYIQGYYFAKPMPAKAFEVMLQKE